MRFMPVFAALAVILFLVSCENDVKRLAPDALITDDTVAGDGDTTGADVDIPVGTDADIPVGTDTPPNDDGEPNTDDIAIDDAIPDDATDIEPVDDETVIPDDDNTVSTLCTDNGGTCVSGQPCPDGSVQNNQYTCAGGGFPPPVCCMPQTATGLRVEVTGPAPVDEAIRKIPATMPQPGQGGTGTPAITGDLGPTALIAIGLIEDNGDGCKEYATAATGTLVLVQRGNCTFSQKITNAQKAGALALIIYNNTGGELQMNADGTLPTVGITQEAGEAIITFTQAHPDITAVIRP